MFSDKNYGLPKDLIEAAKRVHEKQLEEDSHGKMPSKEHVMKMLKDGMSETEMIKMHSDVDKDELKKLVKDCKEEMNEELFTAKKVHEKELEEQQKPTSFKQSLERAGLAATQGVIPKIATKPSAKVVYKAMGGTKPKRAKKPQAEEVQFTEEELAEAFAIFLEENFHVEMLTEEDLDYVFENEFPQWLEESGLSGAFARPERTGRSAQRAARRLNKPIISQSPQDAHVGLTKAARHDDRIRSSRKKILKDNPATTKTNQTTREGRPVTSGGTLPSSMVQGDTKGGYTSAPKPTPAAKPASTAKKQVKRPAPKSQSSGAPKGSFTAYRKSLGLGGNLKAAKSQAYKKAYRTFKARKSPKDWRSSVFNSNN